MKCAVITPVGPGHESLYQQAQESVEAAFKASSGRFSALEVILVDDTAGELGRSEARNRGIAIAADKGCDWIFFLDADDLMVDMAFHNVSRYLDDFDAVWGAIAEFDNASGQASLRLPQLPVIDSLEELVLFDPFVTLQMGHFVRLRVAQKNLFDVDMNTGEDFKYYLGLWREHRCIKQVEPFFVNRRGMNSTGPKSADGHMWRNAVEALLQKEKARLAAAGCLAAADSIKTSGNMKIADLVKAKASIDQAQAQNLAAAYPLSGTLTLTINDTTLHFDNENDDPALLSYCWRQNDALIQLLTSVCILGAKRSVYDVGAGTGLATAALAAAAGARVAAFEPLPNSIDRCRKNLALNRCADSVRCFAGIPAAHAKTGTWYVHADQLGFSYRLRAGGAPGSPPLQPAPCDVQNAIGRGDIEPPELIVIHHSMPAAAIVRQLSSVIERYRPDLFVEMAPDSRIAAGLFVDMLFDFDHGYAPQSVDLLSGEVAPAQASVSVRDSHWFLLRDMRFGGTGHGAV